MSGATVLAPSEGRRHPCRPRFARPSLEWRPRPPTSATQTSGRGAAPAGSHPSAGQRGAVTTVDRARSRGAAAATRGTLASVAVGRLGAMSPRTSARHPVPTSSSRDGSDVTTRAPLDRDAQVVTNSGDVHTRDWSRSRAVRNSGCSRSDLRSKSRHSISPDRSRGSGDALTRSRDTRSSTPGRSTETEPLAINSRPLASSLTFGAWA